VTAEWPTTSVLHQFQLCIIRHETSSYLSDITTEQKAARLSTRNKEARIVELQNAVECGCRISGLLGTAKWSERIEQLIFY